MEMVDYCLKWETTKNWLKKLFFTYNRQKCKKLLNNSYKSLNRFDYNVNLLKYFKLINNFCNYIFNNPFRTK